MAKMKFAKAMGKKNEKPKTNKKKSRKGGKGKKKK